MVSRPHTAHSTLHNKSGIQSAVRAKINHVMGMFLLYSLYDLSLGNLCTHDSQNYNLFTSHLRNSSITPLGSEMLDETMFGHNLNRNCPTNWGNIPHSSAIQNISLCPWEYRMSVDLERYPNEILYARCKCGWCSSDSTNQPVSRCHALYHTYTVIRIMCINNKYEYRYAHETLPIACVCSRSQRRIFLP